MDNNHESKPFHPTYDKLALLKAYKCTQCNRLYSAQIQRDLVTGRIPFLLPCSHTVCEECLRPKSKGKLANIKCKICHVEMIVENDETLRKLCPIDRYKFGALIDLSLSNVPYKFSPYNNYSGGDKKQKVLPFAPAGMQVKQILKRSTSQQTQGKNPKPVCSQQNCRKTAEWKCSNCNDVYCNKCDQHIHESIRILRDHTRYRIDVSYLADFSVSCAIHSEINAEYTCITCDQMLCSKCVIKDHTGDHHEIISIEDKNITEIESLKEHLKKAKIVLRSMESTQKKIEYEITDDHRNYKPSPIENEIITHFAMLHSRLQVQEQQLLKDLQQAQMKKIETINRLSAELKDNIEILSPLIETGNFVTSDKGTAHFDKLLVAKLEKKILDNLNLPCLLSKNDEDDTDNIPEFTIDQSIIDTLEKHCQIKCKLSSSAMKLTPITDFTDKMTEMLEEVSLSRSSSVDETACQIRSRNSSVSSASSSNPGPSQHGRCKTRVSLPNTIPISYEHSTKPEGKSPDDPASFKIGTVEQVKVTHVVNPSLLYVQLTRKAREFDRFTEKYIIYAHCAASPTSPQQGNMYIAEFKTEDFSTWGRAMLINILVTSLIETYEVFFIDYGNTTVVPLSNLRDMKSIFMSEPPFAHRCRMNGLLAQKNEWTDEVLYYMLQFVTALSDPPTDPDELTVFLLTENSNPTLKMKVIKNSRGYLDIDLFSHHESLSYGLLFMGHAQSMSTSSSSLAEQKKIMANERQIVSDIQKFRKNQTYKVLVSHVDDPSLLHIILADNKIVVDKMETQFKKTFKNDKRNLIFAPTVGMNCAAKLAINDDNNWCRVEIVDLPGNSAVTVYAIDYGFTEIIQWDQLRRLRDQYKQADAQAIKVKLADIVPKNESDDGWTSEVIDYLRKIVKNKILTMYVNESSKDQLVITLYENLESSDICLNALLVREGYAEPTGESSLLVEYHKILPEVYDIKRSQHLELLLSDIQTSPPSMIFGNRYCVSIQFLHIESPSLFYVSVPQWCDGRNKLSNNLRRHYSEISPPDKQWTVDEICVGYSEKDKRYYRGIIDKVLDNNCYEIFFKDFAQTEILSTKNLYELDPKFSVIDYSIKCRLSGVKPAGDQGKWSKTGIEYFTELVSKYPQLYITKGDVIITDKTLAVDLIAIFEEDAGPLKPTKVETVRLNQLLLDEGLALPVKVNTGTTLDSVLDDIKLESNPQPKESGGNLTVKDMFKRKETVWLPPYNFTERKFKAWPSYVDDNACVYIHDFKARCILTNIRRMLNQYFSKSGPDPPHLWEAGQMCTVQYHLDNSYYRGLVLKPENDGIIKVRMVDYGSEEDCKHDELRSKYAMTDIPQLAVKCYLADVEPLTEDGTWPVPILDLIHFTLVDKECEIAIQNESLSESPLYIVIYKDNKNINNEIMKNWDWNKLQNIPVSDVHVEENDDVIIEGEVEVDEDDELTEENLMDTDLKYKQCDVPENQKIFNAVVINILNYKTVLIEPSFVASMLKNTSEQFNKLSEEINKHVAKLASAVDPFEGMACVALFSDDNQWYRAEVISINEERTEVQVLFNDYGNLETVPIEDIKIPRKKWLDFPVQMLKCKIWGIEKCDKTTENEASELMNEILRDKTVVCQAMETEPDIQIKLVDPETYDLVYKNLIDDNIIKIVD